MRDIGESCFAWTKKNDAECQISFLSEIGETCNPKTKKTSATTLPGQIYQLPQDCHYG